MTPEQIAVVCHEANRAYCATIGDLSQKPYGEAEAWQRDSAVKGVCFALANPQSPLSAQHENWLKDKLADGWTYGPIKNAELKEHPCCVPYEELPEEQKKKDALFRAIVFALG